MYGCHYHKNQDSALRGMVGENCEIGKGCPGASWVVGNGFLDLEGSYVVVCLLIVSA